jgi:hypothetical protein
MGFQANFFRMKSKDRKETDIQKINPIEGFINSMGKEFFRLFSIQEEETFPAQPTVAPETSSGLALEHDQETNDHREEGSAFHESSGQNHVGTDVAGCFWLASDRFQSGTTDTTDTNACAEGSKASTQSCNTIAETKIACFQEN